MMKTDGTGMRIVLKPKFQKEIFKQLLKQYERYSLMKDLGISSSMLYHYKNYRVKNISQNMMDTIRQLLKLSADKTNENILKSYSLKKSKADILAKGRAINTVLKKELANSDINTREFVKKDCIDLEAWLNKTGWVDKLKSQSGLIKNVEEMQIKEDRILYSYEVYNRIKGSFDQFKITIPKKIAISTDLLYFLGLRFGDGSGHSRFGVINKDVDISEFVFRFLKSTFPESFVHLDVHKYKLFNKEKMRGVLDSLNELMGDLHFTKNESAPGDYALNVYVINSILSRCMRSIFNDLLGFFNVLDFNLKGAFLAGFFDAEGNVNIQRGNMRFSQKIQKNVAVMRVLLSKEGYHVAYCGGNLVVGFRKEYNKQDLELFKRQILPNMRHRSKILAAHNLVKGYLVKEEYKKLVHIIAKNPGVTTKQLFKLIGKKHYWDELRALFRAGYVLRDRRKADESFKYHITTLGFKWLTR
jgi:hypothetical protein